MSPVVRASDNEIRGAGRLLRRHMMERHLPQGQELWVPTQLTTPLQALWGGLICGTPGGLLSTLSSLGRGPKAVQRGPLPRQPPSPVFPSFPLPCHTHPLLVLTTAHSCHRASALQVPLPGTLSPDKPQSLISHLIPSWLSCHLFIQEFLDHFV